MTGLEIQIVGLNSCWKVRIKYQEGVETLRDETHARSTAAEVLACGERARHIVHSDRDPPAAARRGAV